MVKIQIDISEEQNEILKEYNNRLAFSKAQTITILIDKMLMLVKRDFEELVLGNGRIKIDRTVDIIDDSHGTYNPNWVDRTELSEELYIGDLPQDTITINDYSPDKTILCDDTQRINKPIKFDNK